MSATDEPRDTERTGVDTTKGAGSSVLPTETAYEQVQHSPEFAALRKRWRGFIFPMSAIFLLWFLAYVLLSAYAPGVVNTTVGDSNITIGLILGLLQFVTTFLIATLYIRFADRRLDPEASRLREAVEEKL